MNAAGLGRRSQGLAGEVCRCVREDDRLGNESGADIRSFFDTLDHDLLLELVGRRISARRIVKLIRHWLSAGVVVDGRWQATTRACRREA